MKSTVFAIVRVSSLCPQLTITNLQVTYSRHLPPPQPSSQRRRPTGENMPCDAETTKKVHSKARWGAVDELKELLKIEGAGAWCVQRGSMCCAHCGAAVQRARVLCALFRVVRAWCVFVCAQCACSLV